MAKYKLSSDGVVDTEKHLHIPNNQKNYDWKLYEKWLEEGNTPDPEDIQEEVIDPRIALIDNIQTINDIKTVLKQLFGLNS